MSEQEQLRTLEARVKPFGEHVLSPEDLALLRKLRGEPHDEEDYELEAEEPEDEA